MNDQLNGISEIRVFAPATVSNIGCGFDIFGFALDEPGDEVILRVTNRKGVRLVKITGDKGKLPTAVSKNTCTVALTTMMEKLNLEFGVEIELHKKMPLGSGLGSSAASAVAGIYALNSILKKPVTTHELLPFALEGERISSGKIVHADNVAPALFGGFILIRSNDPVDIISIPIPKDFYCTILHPHIEINTAYARSILPDTIKTQNAIKQWGNTAGLVAGLMKRDYDLVRRSITDNFAEPVRSKLIPGYDQIKEAVKMYDAFGFGISGSGPSLFALSRTKLDALKIGNIMKKVLFQSAKIEGDIYISGINLYGPKILG
ncbi:MAG: homoserine kinase [Ignavibacteria bacterium]|jgi:homoserine kinase|nr:homoserine kinase [Ignavibacteria bacterium]